MNFYQNTQAPSHNQILLIAPFGYCLITQLSHCAELYYLQFPCDKSEVTDQHVPVL